MSCPVACARTFLRVPGSFLISHPTQQRRWRPRVRKDRDRRCDSVGPCAFTNWASVTWWHYLSEPMERPGHRILTVEPGLPGRDGSSVGVHVRVLGFLGLVVLPLIAPATGAGLEQCAVSAIDTSRPTGTSGI